MGHIRYVVFVKPQRHAFLHWGFLAILSIMDADECVFCMNASHMGSSFVVVRLGKMPQFFSLELVSCLSRSFRPTQGLRTRRAGLGSGIGIPLGQLFDLRDQIYYAEGFRHNVVL